MRKIYIFMEEELKRTQLMNRVISGSLSLKQAQQLLGLSYRQTLRMKKRFLTEGFEGLLRRKTKRPVAVKITQELKERILNLRESFYWDFNILHFRDKLKGEHGISLSYESIRRILIEGGLHEPKKKKEFAKEIRRM
ncbi:MAG: helix-turn-helix domain-containing protein [Thermodesulfovibrio sp.]|nr:helix-turn-helix domain-containing protein [Thermodesulfovibrio sp.]